MLLARGSVTDRPWGQTLGALGTKRLSGQVTVVSEGKEYAIVFDDGAIIAASSPAVADAAVRIALTNHLISKTQVNDLTRRIAAAPDRDDLDVIAEATKLSPEHVDRLRRKVTAQRAARTFSLESGEFSVNDEVRLATVPDMVGIDVRAVIYLGARLNVTGPAMTEALRVFGDAYVLKPEAESTLSLFEFTDPVETTILAELRTGTSLPELEAAHRDIDPRTAEAMIYALMSVGACHSQAAPAIPRAGTSTITQKQPALKRPTAPPAAARTVSRDSSSSFGPFVSRTSSITPPPSVGRTPTPASAIRREFDDGTATPAAMRASRGHTDAPPTGRASSPSMPPMAVGTKTGSTPAIASGTQSRQTPRLGTNSPTGNPQFGRASTSNPAVSRTPTDPSPGRSPTPPSMGRSPTPSSPVIGRAPTNNPSISRTTTVRKTKALIAARSILFEQGADHFALLGVPFDAPLDIVRTTYLNLSRQLHPDKLAELGVEDSGGIAGKLFSQMGLAFAVLTDNARRTEYMASLLRPDVALPPAAPPPPAARTKTSEEVLGEALEAFKRGESALRRDEPIEACLAFAKAVELQPNNADYVGLLGWAQFCAATDKAAAAVKTRQALDKMIQKSDKPVRGRFLLGRVERMLGRDREAKYHFEQVIDLQPNHQEAQSEIRAIELRARTKR